MITAQRQRRRRRASTVVASLAVAAGLIGAFAAPAAAATAVVGDFAAGEHLTIEGTIDGAAQVEEAGLFQLQIDGQPAKGYCIDMESPVPASLPEVEWATSELPGLDDVEKILANYYPTGNGPEGYTLIGDNAEKAAATQAALWHATNDFVLEPVDGGDENDPEVITNYETILDALEAGVLTGFGPAIDLTIEPASLAGTAGQLTGPFVVNTNAASVELTTANGTTLHDADGEPFVGPATDGTEVWVRSDTAGSDTVTATASSEATSGRLFHQSGKQPVAVPVTAPTDAVASIELTFQTPPSTTAPPTTLPPTTTVPPTSQTTVVTDTPTTTVPIVPASNTGGGLPNTGAPTMILLGVALVLVVVGAGFGIVSRRKRLES